MPHPQLCRPLLAAGRTLLHWACDAGHADIVDSLLARMTDPARAAAYVWRTFRADDHRRAFTKKMVAESTVDVRDARGSTPLHLACRAGRLDIVVKLLRVANADRIVPDADGRVAFELLEPRKIEILRLLLIRD
jgi:ankyrin repeat protein